jgi:hypothetical protein
MCRRALLANALYISSLEELLWDGAVLEGLLGVHRTCLL